MGGLQGDRAPPAVDAPPTRESSLLTSLSFLTSQQEILRQRWVQHRLRGRVSRGIELLRRWMPLQPGNPRLNCWVCHGPVLLSKQAKMEMQLEKNQRRVQSEVEDKK